MEIAIVGTGSIALGTSVLLAKAGHTPLLVSLSGRGGSALASGVLMATGAIEGEVQIELSSSVEAAFRRTKHIVIATSADRYGSVLQSIVQHVRTDHRILISGELSCFGLALQHELVKEQKYPSVTSLASTPVTGRRGQGSQVHIGLIRSSVLAYAHAHNGNDDEVAAWNLLLGGALMPCASPAHVLLSNLNPIAHAPNALCNLTRMEKAEDWSNFGGITPGVSNLLIALDGERLGIGRKLGSQLVSFKDSFGSANGFPAEMSLPQMMQEMDVKRSGQPRGPRSLASRYVTEDVPFGLVVYERLGTLLGIGTPMTTSTISVLSAIYDRDFRVENCFLEHLSALVISRE